MKNAALLGLMRQLGMDIVTLTEETDEREFFASRLTRMETLRLLRSMTQTVANIPEEVRAGMPLIDWAAWLQLQAKLIYPAQFPLQIWVAIKELTPETVLQLNEYRRTNPKLFSLAP